MTSGMVRMSDIIRDAAAIPVCLTSNLYHTSPQGSSRKRKQGGADIKSLNVSALDGAVDDLFAASTPEPSSASSMIGISSTMYSQQADKSELVFDAEGNMVLQVVSAGAGSERISSAEATTTVDSATCGYDFAYRRPKPTKWSLDDTTKFYEALEMYGSDQMLINTMLPQFSAVQIRQKFKAEERNNAAKFRRVLYGSKKELNSLKFEQQHGLILNPVFDHKSEVTSLEDSIGAAIDAAITTATEGGWELPPPATTQEHEDDSLVDPLDILFS